MLNVRLPIVASVWLLAGQLAHANVEVTFVESAPKDRFVLHNTSQCALNGLTVHLDLSNSVGRLIFDTTATGAGVEVFQPFEVKKGNLKLISASEVKKGNLKLISASEVKDGDSTLSLSIQSIAANDSVSFTIDVDDTLTQSELGNIRVSGSEITNALIEITTKEQQTSVAMFDNKGKAMVPFPSC
tara:strand:- start:132 stop:689 length:558 start_codon:yes stop_codon:yes gene_type:complete